MKLISLIGQVFERLTVMEYCGASHWKCLCFCGNEKIIDGSSLTRRISKSCGCYRKEKISLINKGNIKHGHSRRGKVSRAHHIWNNMLNRCNNKNCPEYKNYGERGITVCNEWNPKKGGSFANFYEDVGEPPKGMSFDRTNNNEGYFPDNWRWATPKEQTNNRRNTRNLILYNYEKKLRSLLKGLITRGKNKISFSKNLPYNSKQLCEHLEKIRESQNNSCPMCHKSYNEIKYDIDHVVPTSIAKTKEELLKLFGLNNLSLLCWNCNRHIKRDKIITYAK